MNLKKAYRNGSVIIMGILCAYFTSACNNSSHLFETETVSEVSVLEDETESIVESTEMLEKGILVTKVFRENNIQIKYPQITNMANGSLEKQINLLLEEDALKILEYYQVNFAGDTMKVDFEVKRCDEERMSLIYTGDYVWQGAANPANLFYSSNIHLKSGERISLADTENIDEIVSNLKSMDVYEIITESEELLTVVEDNLREIELEELKRMLEHADFKDKDSGSYPEIFSYSTEKDEGFISYPLINTLEDYVLIKIK